MCVGVEEVVYGSPGVVVRADAVSIDLVDLKWLTLILDTKIFESNQCTIANVNMNWPISESTSLSSSETPIQPMRHENGWCC